jgi:hypothetical protein
MIWLALSAYAVLGLVFIVGLCRAASRANAAGLQLIRRAPEPTDLTEAEEQAERVASSRQVESSTARRPEGRANSRPGAHRRRRGRMRSG